MSSFIKVRVRGHTRDQAMRKEKIGTQTCVILHMHAWVNSSRKALRSVCIGMSIAKF